MFVFVFLIVLFCSKYSISRVPKSWQDIAVAVEFAVDGCGVDGNIGVRFLHRGNAFWAADEAHKFDAFGAQLFDAINCRHSGVTSCQHWIDHDHMALLHLLGHLEIVFHSREGLGIAV